MKRMPKVFGNDVTERQIMSWTAKDKTWSEWRMGAEVEGSKRHEKCIERKTNRSEG